MDKGDLTADVVMVGGQLAGPTAAASAAMSGALAVIAQKSAALGGLAARPAASSGLSAATN